ncbi:hypothetical protein [Chlamydia felis Fe/C-56]|uniref:Uncharacterized protein n=1 Tax=Chlamydia felis (strain Fe/C-56) TaxID=264202 RepID=Q255Y2_CHLFF|nr:hypothetical protein [Chlamydia felis Fe/C-56]
MSLYRSTSRDYRKFAIVHKNKLQVNPKYKRRHYYEQRKFFLNNCYQLNNHATSFPSNKTTSLMKIKYVLLLKKALILHWLTH